MINKIISFIYFLRRTFFGLSETDKDEIKYYYFYLRDTLTENTSHIVYIYKQLVNDIKEHKKLLKLMEYEHADCPIDLANKRTSIKYREQKLKKYIEDNKRIIEIYEYIHKKYDINITDYRDFEYKVYGKVSGEC